MMKKPVRSSVHPLFLEALDVYSYDIEKFKRLIKKSELSIFERKILGLHLKIRENKLNDVFVALDKFHSENVFLMAQKFLLLGLACNNQGEPKKAIGYFKESIKWYEKIDENQQVFFAIFNLVLALENLGKVSEMSKYVSMLEKIPQINPIMQISYLRALAAQYDLQRNYKRAMYALDEAFDLTLVNKKIAHYQSFLLVDKFILLFKMGKYVECERLLNDYNDIRIFRVSANYNFMKILLSNFLHGTPVYFEKSDFANVPLLHAQISFIKALASFDRGGMSRWWNELVEINPLVYLEGFKYKGEVCLFSKCVEKYKANLKVGKVMTEKLLDLTNFKGSVQDKLIYILRNQESPIGRKELIGMLWEGEQYCLQMENRLDALIYRVRKSLKLNIKKEKHFYKLVA
jgi:tetratricopeptide (TPR) repeat protein